MKSADKIAGVGRCSVLILARNRQRKRRTSITVSVWGSRRRRDTLVKFARECPFISVGYIYARQRALDLVTYGGKHPKCESVPA